MKNWLFLAVILILCICQIGVLDNFRLFNIKPDLLFIAVMIAAICCKPRWAILLGLFAGALKDIFTATPFGINTVLFPLWALAIIQLAKRILINEHFIPVISIFIMVALNNAINRLIFISLGKSISLGAFLRVLFLEALYTALVLPLVFKALKIRN